MELGRRSVEQPSDFTSGEARGFVALLASRVSL